SARPARPARRRAPHARPPQGTSSPPCHEPSSRPRRRRRMSTTRDYRALALDRLRSIFGYPGFRGEQAAIIEHVCGGGDALVLMPTGGGKSLCYQVPALLRDGVGVVVSPLIALMQDQVDALAAVGVRAACLNSQLSAARAQ